MSSIIRFGIDLAKNSFAIAGVDHREKLILRKTLKRQALLTFFAQQQPALVVMEAGSGAHHWARALIDMGHDARIIDPRFVAPYRQQGRSGKNDLNDAVAICEAGGRPQMRFVPVKTVHQQAVLVVHRLRASAVVQHTRIINQMRGLMAEFGLIVARGSSEFKSQWPKIRIRHADQLPPLAWQSLDHLFQRMLAIHQDILGFDRQIKQFVRQDDNAARLMDISGIGAVTASAVVATIGNGRDFKNGRQFAAWLGLTPRQYSTGGKPRLGKITKRGDVYLRTLLVQGAQAALQKAKHRDDRKSRWICHLLQSKSWNTTAVALANKHARIIWAMLANQTPYQPS